MSDRKDKSSKKEYKFGGIKEFNLEEIESEVLNDSVYLDVFAGSDAAFKEDLRPIENPLEKLAGLDGVSFNYRVDEFPQKNFDRSRQVGFIAQAVEKVMPELTKRDNEGHLHVNYAQFAPLLVESIKTLNEKLEAQEREIQKLREELNIEASGDSAKTSEMEEKAKTS